MSIFSSSAFQISSSTLFRFSAAFLIFSSITSKIFHPRRGPFFPSRWNVSVSLWIILSSIFSTLFHFSTCILSFSSSRQISSSFSSLHPFSSHRVNSISSKCLFSPIILFFFFSTLTSLHRMKFHLFPFWFPACFSPLSCFSSSPKFVPLSSSPLHFLLSVTSNFFFPLSISYILSHLLCHVKNLSSPPLFLSRQIPSPLSSRHPFAPFFLPSSRPERPSLFSALLTRVPRGCARKRRY